MAHGIRCDCKRCFARYMDALNDAVNGSSSRGDTQSSIGTSQRFEGKAIKVVVGATGRKDRLEFYYGGASYPDGPGHGHVVCNDGETINFWRKPVHEGGQIVIDDKWSTERLMNHMF